MFAIGGLPLVSGRARIVAVAVRSGNLAVLVVDDQLGTLVSADFSGSINRLTLCVAVSRGAFRTTSFDIPAAIGGGNNVMRVSFSFSHVPFSFLLSSNSQHDNDVSGESQPFCEFHLSVLLSHEVL
jgi:hypothetical protein